MVSVFTRGAECRASTSHRFTYVEPPRDEAPSEVEPPPPFRQVNHAPRLACHVPLADQAGQILIEPAPKGRK